MKKKEEMNVLKEENETVGKRLCKSAEDELNQVVGGIDHRKNYSAKLWKDLLRYFLKNE